MASKNERFIEEFGVFQGNMQEASFDAIYNVLHTSLKPKLLLLINTTEMFEKAFEKGLTFDGTNNVDTQWKLPYTVEHIQLLEKYNYPRMLELYKTVLNNSRKSEEAIDYIYENISMDSLLKIEKSNFEEHELRALFRNNNFNLFEYIENRYNDNQQRTYMKSTVYSLITEHYNAEIIVEFAKKKCCNIPEILAYMVNNDMLDQQVLNQLDEDKKPLYSNFYSFSAYINPKTGKVFEKIDFSLIENNNTEDNIVDRVLREQNDKLGVFKQFINSIDPDYKNMVNKKGKTAAFILSDALYYENRIDYIESVLNSGIDLTIKDKEGRFFFEGSVGNQNVAILFHIIFEKEKWNIQDEKFKPLRDALYNAFIKSVDDFDNSGRIRNSDMKQVMQNMLIPAEKIFLEMESLIPVEKKSNINRI